MTFAEEAAPLFENAEWQVTSAGLEHKRNGYFIEREQLGERRADGAWLWPAHLAEKSWCAPAPFAEAFQAALDHFGIPANEALAPSLERRRPASAPISERGEPVSLGALVAVEVEFLAFGRSRRRKAG
jgi:hypothetical protein